LVPAAYGGGAAEAVALPRLPSAVVSRLRARIACAAPFASGYHNSNYLVALPPDEASAIGASQVKVRVRRKGAPTVVQRTWSDESALLHQLQGLPIAPRVLHAMEDGLAVYSYLEGVPLAAVCPSGTAVPEEYAQQIPGVFAAMLGAELAAPFSRPRNPDADEFFRDRIRFAQRELSDAYRPRYGKLFQAFGVTERAIEEFGARIPSLRQRQFGLLHTDVHRSNLIIAGGELRVIDWEHAMIGDPLYDLATHLCRMGYPAKQWDAVVADWQRAVPAECGAGLEDDLRFYIDYERAQSVYPDIIRATRSLGAGPEESTLQHAARWIESSLRRAADPLRLSSLPSLSEVTDLLLRWHAEFGPGRRGCGEGLSSQVKAR
jgi:aminoglycoside phosphotransferase (APT) family kinase protein